MITLLINVLIIIVVGAICFYVIDKFVRDGRLAKLLKLLVGARLPSRNPPAAAAGVGRGVLMPSAARPPERAQGVIWRTRRHPQALRM